METLAEYFERLTVVLVSDPSVTVPLIIVWVAGILAIRRLLRRLDLIEEEEGPSSEEDDRSGRQS